MACYQMKLLICLLAGFTMAKNKSEHPIVSDKILYKNYDLYDIGQKRPPVSFYNEMYKFKSVEEFLKKQKRKKNKNKKKKIERRKRAFLIIASMDNNHIDFPLDDQTTPILEPTESLQGANAIGVVDPYTPGNDFDDKNISNLNYGRDYPKEIIYELYDEPLAPSDYSPYGLPEGIDREEGGADTILDAQRYGNTSSGNTAYSNISW